MLGFACTCTNIKHAHLTQPGFYPLPCLCLPPLSLPTSSRQTQRPAYFLPVLCVRASCPQFSTPGMHLPPVPLWSSFSHSGLSLKWPSHHLNSQSCPVIRYPHALTTIQNVSDLLAYLLICWFTGCLPSAEYRPLLSHSACGILCCIPATLNSTAHAVGAQ